MLQDVNLSNTVFQATVENSYDLIALLDQEGTFLYTNPAFSRVLGLGRQELVGRDSLERVHPDDRPALELELAEAFRKGRGEVGAYRYRTASGDWRWFESSGAVVEADGAPSAIVVISRDVTDRKAAEEAASQIQLNFQSIFEAIPEGIVVHEDARVVNANSAMLEMVGYTMEQVRGRIVWEMIAPEYHTLIQENMRNGRMKPYEVEIICANGKRLPVEFLGRPYVHEGRAARLVVIRDITERKRVEEFQARFNRQLEEQHRHLNDVLRNVPGIVWERDIDPRSNKSSVKFVSDYAGVMLGYEPQIWMAEPEFWLSRIHPDDRSSTARNVALLVAEGATGTLQHRMLAKDGRTVWVETHYATVKNERGEVTGLRGVTMDITQRWQALEEQRRLITLLEAATDLVGWADASGAIQYLNPAGRRVLGLMWNEDLEGVSLADFLSRSAAKVLWNQALPKAAHQGTWSGEITLVSRDGRQIPFSLVLTCHKSTNGEVQFYSTIARDIKAQKETEAALQRAKEELEQRVQERTQELAASNHALQEQVLERQVALGALQEAVVAHQQAREEADQANRAKSEFLSRMSHELRTPLNAILGFGQLLEMADLPPKRMESVRHIVKAGQHLLGLINDVLDISRIEAGNLSLSLEPVRVEDAVFEVFDLLRPLARPVKIELLAETPAFVGWGCYVQADRQRLKQVLLNLVSNAIKYNRPGGSVTVSGCPGRTADTFRITVSDTGNGLSEADMGKLFTPFERLDAAQTKVEGTGIGLVLSRRLMEAMEGNIGVQSTLGVGSTFWLELPSAVNPMVGTLDELELAKGPLFTEEASVWPKTVLYIEDNLPNLDLIEMLFENRPDIHLLTAMQGSTGLDLAIEHQPDLILLDIHLPDINGAEVLRRLRANPATMSIPVVVISADATAGQVQRLLSAGATAYLTKPIDVRQFMQVVTENLE